MKYIFKSSLACVCIFFYLLADNEPQAVVEKKQNKLFVRVLLQEKNLTDTSCWELTSNDGLIVFDIENPATKSLYKAARVTTQQAGLHIVDPEQRFLENVQIVHIVPRDGFITVNATCYQGSIFVCVQDKKALLINSIALEDYIFSVVKSESWPGWPIEVNKVLAIAARSYVIKKVLEAQQQSKVYHIKNTNVHQTYTGYHNSVDIRRAVEETRDIFMSYDGQPILAMFDICCGGVIPAKKKGVNFNHAPYLARSYPCTYCKSYKVFSWKAEYSPHELEELFKKEIPQLRKIREIKVNKKDEAGLVTQIAIKAASGYHYLNGKKIYSLLKRTKSLCFSVNKKSHNYRFDGKGHGHHMGLCQWGTRKMVQEGWPCDRILKFFYPGTTFMRLTRLPQETYS